MVVLEGRLCIGRIKQKALSYNMMSARISWWERFTNAAFARKGWRAVSPRVVSEANFHARVAEERLRSEQTGSHCRIVTVYVCDHLGSSASMENTLSRHIIGVLSAALRKTDYVGWYREGRIVGALLTVVGHDRSQEPYSLLEQRLRNSLQVSLPGTYASLRLHIGTPDDVQEFNGL